MRKCLNLFAADADQWESDGMSLADEDALISALWKWYRGRADSDGLSVTAKVLYSSITKRLEASESLYEARSRGGKKGMANRWSNKSVNKSVITEPITGSQYPTASSTSPSSASSSTYEYNGDTPEPPSVSVEDLMKVSCNPSGGKAERFVKPTADDVRAYCSAQGITNVDAEQFVDYYNGNGWMVGKVKMKDWQATIRNWSRRHLQSGKTEPTFKQDGYTIRLGKESK